LLAEVQAVAEEERRAPAEIVQEAIERYMDEREWRKLLAYGQERARTLGLTEADVPRLIAEARQEKRRESGKAAE
jgi:predicted DNA-binding protein